MEANFHLHCLGHKVKYRNPEIGNTAQQFLSTTRPCYIEFIESFLCWVILVTHYMAIYICIYIHKVIYIHSFFVIFNCNSFFCIGCYTFWDMKKYLRNWRVNCFIARSIKWCGTSRSSYWIHFLFYIAYFFSRKLCFLWSPCLLLIAEFIRPQSVS